MTSVLENNTSATGVPPPKGPTVRDVVSKWLAAIADADGPGTVVASADAYGPVQAARPGTAQETIREALQSLSVGSNRTGPRCANKVYAVYLKEPDDDGKTSRYLAISEIPRDRIGQVATDTTRRIQLEFQEALGPHVTGFWIKQVQLQAISMARGGKNVVHGRDKGRCKICGSETVTVCHLVRRRDVFWHVLADVVARNAGDHSSIFSASGVQEIVAGLKAESFHTSPKYMVCLCKQHDAMIQRTLYPSAT